MIINDNNLREKAYGIIKRKGEEFSLKFEHSDLKTILHELDVYQAELEAQNEELREKEHELLILSERNKKLFYEAPFPYVILDNNFSIVDSNYLAESFFHFNKSKKSKILFSSFIKEGQLRTFLDWIISKNYKDNYLELYLVSFEKTSNKFRLFLSDYSDEKKGWYLLTLRDIQKEIDLTHELNNKNLLLNEITQNQENMLMVYDENRNVIFLNDRFLEFFDSDNISDFIIKYGNVCNVFIKEDSFFSVDTKINFNWFELLINSHNEDNIVLLNDKKTDKVKAFLISISKSKTNNFICSFSEITSISLQKSELEKRVFYDELTQVYNRAKFNDFLKEEFSFFKREELDLSVIMFDIDFFKNINDNYGHDAGDEVLKYLCEIVKERLRESDIFARWGGEEFVILLKACQKEDAYAFAEYLRQKIESSIFINEIKVTCSFGVTSIQKDDSIKTFLKRVDSLLYKSKNLGRNCVSC